MAMHEWKRGASMVTVTVNGETHELSNSTAAALFGSVKGDGRVFPVTLKVSAVQKAWLYETAGAIGVTVSTLIADIIEKERTR